MDDIDTRLESERPDVADALKSMNWEERLAEARSRRKAVLKQTDKAEKRPVVRIVDAAAMAQRRAGAQARPPVTKEPVTAAPVATPLPVPAHDTAATGVREEPAAKSETTVGSVAGRTALGFGLGLGLGASLVAGVFLVMGMPGSSLVAVPEAPVEAASIATGPAPVVDAAAVAPSRTGPQASAGSPIISVEAPARGVAPAFEVAAAAPSAVASMRPTVTPAPQRPPVASAERPFELVLVPPAQMPFARDFALGEPPAPAVAPAILPAAWPSSLPLDRPAAVSAALPDTSPARGDGPSRPAGGVAPRGVTFVPGEAAAPLLPGAAAAPLPMSLPIGPSALTPREPGPALFAAPPAAPVKPKTGGDVRIPHGEALFVRIVVPETVSDAEAEDIAGLLMTAGVGDGRISRVIADRAEILRLAGAADAMDGHPVPTNGKPVLAGDPIAAVHGI